MFSGKELDGAGLPGAEINLSRFRFGLVAFIGTLALPVDLVFYFAEYKITFNA
jgi:hypothetical protein